MEKTAWILFGVEQGADSKAVAQAIWGQQEPKNSANDRWVVRADVVQGLDPWRIVVPVIGVGADEDEAKAKIKNVISEITAEDGGVAGVTCAAIVAVTDHFPPDKDKGWKPKKDDERGHNAWG